MAVIVNAIKKIDDDKNWIYITLTVDGDECRQTSVNPWNAPGPPLEGQALEDWCNNREDWFALNILKQMYPGARYTATEGQSELEAFEAWKVNHTNTAYCSIAEHDTEETCLEAGGTWTPEEVITKVPFTNSHDYAGDMRVRKLEELNVDLQGYLYTKYDVGTQISFQAIDSRPDTPEVVKTAMQGLFTWISGVMNYYYAKKKLIRDNEDWESVTWDFTTFDSTDPNISLEALMG